MKNIKKYYKCSPHLPVKNLQETLNYYRGVLGFTDEWTFGDIDAGIRKDELRLIFAQDESFTNDINNQKHRLPLIWFVTNFEEIYDDFKEMGIEIAEELQSDSLWS